MNNNIIACKKKTRRIWYMIMFLTDGEMGFLGGDSSEISANRIIDDDTFF